MRRRRGILVVAAVLAALLIQAVLPAEEDGLAANLTGGEWTYVVNGEEASFTFDPVALKDGLLLPEEVFRSFGVTVEEAVPRTLTVSGRGTVLALTLGIPALEINGEFDSLATSPLRLNGRLFLPAEVLRYFGVEVVEDGRFILLADGGPGLASPTRLADAEYAALLDKNQFAASVRADRGYYMTGVFTLLTPEIVGAANLDVRPAIRARLQNLLRTNTLVLLRVTNGTAQAGSVLTDQFYAVDDLANAYSLVTAMDMGRGPLSDKLLPSQVRTGILVFPKVARGAQRLSIYYDANRAVLGGFRFRQ